MPAIVCASSGFRSRTHASAPKPSSGFGENRTSGIRVFQHLGVLQHRRFVSTRRNLVGTASTITSGIADAAAALESSQTKTEILEGPYHGKKAVVVGAGPGGSMAAMMLARRGFDVKIFEKRKNPTVVPMEIERSITLLLNPEVTELMMGVGIEVPLDEYSNGITAFKHGTRTNSSGEVITHKHYQNGTRALAERHCIANAVLQAAVSQQNLEFVFESACQGIDVNAKVARFSNADNEIEETPYDLLVGADGINSCVREALEKSGHVECKQRKCLKKYASIRNLPIPAKLSGYLETVLEVGVPSFFTFDTKMRKPTPTRGVFYRTENGCVQMNVLAHVKAFENIKGREKEWVNEAFPSVFPKEWMDPIANTLREKPLSTIGPATYCSSYVGPDVALIGDACHSATPSLGIGANQAILDVKALDKALGEHDGDLEKALQTYDEVTRPQVAAIQDLEFKQASSGLESQNPFWLAFNWIYIVYHSLGAKLFPKLIPPAVQFQLMASLITPKAALRSFNREACIFFGTIGAAVFAALAWCLKAFSGFV